MGIIIKPLVTEKMTAITEKLNRFGFIVRPEANKLEIKSEIEALYGGYDGGYHFKAVKSLV